MFKGLLAQLGQTILQCVSSLVV